MLGKLEKGSPMAAEIENAQQITGIIDGESDVSRLKWTMMGNKIIDATVCETKVVRPRTRTQRHNVKSQTLVDGSARMTN